jgi:hypothetical protein
MAGGAAGAADASGAVGAVTSAEELVSFSLTPWQDATRNKHINTGSKRNIFILLKYD